jgi:hypothetical protein
MRYVKLAEDRRDEPANDRPQAPFERGLAWLAQLRNRRLKLSNRLRGVRFAAQSQRSKESDNQNRDTNGHTSHIPSEPAWLAGKKWRVRTLLVGGSSLNN